VIRDLRKTIEASGRRKMADDRLKQSRGEHSTACFYDELYWDKYWGKGFQVVRKRLKRG